MTTEQKPQDANEGTMGPSRSTVGLERQRWDVSSFNRRGIAHWWVDSPSNDGLVRSHCGSVDAKRNLQGLAHELARCKVCEKAMRSNAGVTGA